jgi:hypothetical protein
LQTGVIVGAFAVQVTDHVCKGNDDGNAWADAEKIARRGADNGLHRLTLFNRAPML